MQEAPIHTVVETGSFTMRVKKLGLSLHELASIYDVYATTPDYGKVIRNTGGAPKPSTSRPQV